MGNVKCVDWKVEAKHNLAWLRRPPDLCVNWEQTLLNQFSVMTIGIAFIKQGMMWHSPLRVTGVVHLLERMR